MYGEMLVVILLTCFLIQMSMDECQVNEPFRVGQPLHFLSAQNHVMHPGSTLAKCLCRFGVLLFRKCTIMGLLMAKKIQIALALYFVPEMWTHPLFPLNIMINGK